MHIHVPYTIKLKLAIEPIREPIGIKHKQSLKSNALSRFECFSSYKLQKICALIFVDRTYRQLAVIRV